MAPAMGDPIYLDYNATTPPAPEVLDAMRGALDAWGNPSSAHAYGRRARAAVERAREQVAALLGCGTDEVLFTSGGTESDNAAIFGVADALALRGRHIVISVVEHAAVEQAVRWLEDRGAAITRVPVDGSCRVAPGAVRDALRPDTVLVSILHAQNETGVLEPVAEIAALAREHGIPFHTDAAQSVGKVRVDLGELGADLLTLAGHKLYGPQGVGALIVRRGTPFAPLLRGAGHEGGRRSGTENVAGIVGLGAACALAERELPARTAHMTEMRDRLARGLARLIPDLVVHGAGAERLPNTLSVAIPGTRAFDVASRADGVAIAAGPACHSGRPHVSSVLRAMGVPDDLSLATLRLTVGRPTTADEIDRAVTSIGAAAAAAAAAG
jgi:cysteine desulfurase